MGSFLVVAGPSWSRAAGSPLSAPSADSERVGPAGSSVGHGERTVSGRAAPTVTDPPANPVSIVQNLSANDSNGTVVRVTLPHAVTVPDVLVVGCLARNFSGTDALAASDSISDSFELDRGFAGFQNGSKNFTGGIFSTAVNANATDTVSC